MDTLEQRLTADLTDAAEAAMTAGLTPPDHAKVLAGAAARQRSRRMRARVAVAAVVLATGGLVVAIAGANDPSDTHVTPANTGTSAPPTTGSTTTATDDTTPGTDTTDGTTADDTDTPGSGTGSDTTASVPPNDPEQPGPGEPNPLPITEDVVRSIAYPFNQGIDALPAPCRDYWVDTGFTPEGNGLSLDQSGIVIDEATITLADIDGDGTDDGMASYICETGGTIPPGGIIALIAEPGEPGAFGIYLDDGSITDVHEQQFGDPRTRFTGPFQLIGESTGLRDIEVELNSYRPGDANAGGSAQAIARYRVTGNTLELVELRQA